MVAARSLEVTSCLLISNDHWLTHTPRILFPCLRQPGVKAQGPVHPLVKPRKAWNNNERTSHAWASKARRRRRHCRWVSRRYFHHVKCMSPSLQQISPSSIKQGDVLFSALWSGQILTYFCLSEVVRIWHLTAIVFIHVCHHICITINHRGHVTVSNRSPAFGLLIFLHSAAVVSPSVFSKSFSLFPFFIIVCHNCMIA